MSTLAYAALTNARDAAPPNTSFDQNKPGMQTYIDAFAALVPAEVLTLHALIIAATTTIPPAAKDAVAAASTIPVESAPTLKYAFWGLVFASAALYAAARWLNGKLDRYDWVRIWLAPLAFVGWTMIQRTTAFDAAFPQLAQAPRTVLALFLGAALGVLAAALAAKADQKTPVP